MEDRPGLVTLRLEGKGARMLQAEAGGHRFQRVPPTERSGRVHSSTLTVAVLPEVEEAVLRIDDRDLEVRTTRGSGPGGQARNKTESCVVLTHKPSGLVVRSDAQRHQSENRRVGLALLRARLAEVQRQAREGEAHAARRQMVGTAERSDRRRTVTVSRDEVVDHRTGKRTTWKLYQRGHIEALWT